MHVSATVKCLRLSTIRVQPRPPLLATFPHTSRSQRRHARTSHHPDIPPPVTPTPLRRPATGRSPRLRPQLSARVAPSSAATGAARLPPVSWTDALPTGIGGAAPSRVALSEVASLCLSVEAPRCYAVYRPFESDAAAPHHFLELLRHLRTAPSLSLEARRVAGVLVDLLNKSPHPHYPSAWDATQEEVRQIKASAIAHVMECIDSGDDALSWLAELLRLSDIRAEVDAAPSAHVQLAVMERLGRRGNADAQRIQAHDPDSSWLLSCSSIVLSAIAAAMLRSPVDGMKARAFEVLESAALSRLSRSTSPPSPAASAAVGLHSVKTPSREAAPLFNEEVAVHCAEAAAVRGDVETVTRLIFLLYRARGALGFATLAEHRRQRRSSESSRESPRWSVGGLFPRTPAWVTSKWWSGAAGTVFASAGEADAAGGDDADARFEQAAVRLLKGVMHAVLYHPHRSGDAVGSSVEEALSLWDGLRGGTSWPGLAAMGVEFLLYLVDQHVLLTAAVEGSECAAAMDAHLQRAGLRVYTQLCRAATTRRRTSAQQEVLDYCVVLIMRLHATSTAIRVGEGSTATTLPTVSTAAAAEHILRLFAQVRGPRQREALLPYALAASLTIFSLAASSRPYRAPVSLFGGLARYFSEAQSLHFYCAAASNTAQAPVNVSVCGGLILLHVFLLSSVHLRSWAREDGDLWTFAQRLSGSAVFGEGNALVRRDEQCAQLLSWLRVSGEEQRQLLWALLTSLKRCEVRWCSATHNVFASPASSTVVCTAVAAIRPELHPSEMQSVLKLLYECGNTDDPLHAHETLDSVVSYCVQTPVRTLALHDLTELLQRASAVGAGAAVLILGDASLRAIAQRSETANAAATVDDGLETLVRLVQPLLRGDAVKPTQSFVFLVLTPACLLELQRLRTRSSVESRRDNGIIEALHSALFDCAAHRHFRVAVASSWPLLPSMALARRQSGGLHNVDGLREAASVARHVEHTFSKESRPVVGLWAEADPASSAGRMRLLQHYGAREVSTHRANLENAKSDIFSLLRTSPSGAACDPDLRVSAEVAAAKVSAARRLRNRSLLSAVSPKRKGHHTS